MGKSQGGHGTKATHRNVSGMEKGPEPRAKFLSEFRVCGGWGVGDDLGAKECKDEDV